MTSKISYPPPDELQQPTNVRTLVFAMACGISFLLYLHRYTWGFIKTDVKQEFGWNDTTMGWVDGLFAFSYAIAQIPSGIVCDWFGSHLLLGTIIILWSVALTGFALARDLTSMCAARLAFGIAQAGCYPALNKVSKNWFPLIGRTAAQGWIATFSARAGGALSFILIGPVLLHGLGLTWREALFVLTVLGIGCGMLFLLLFRNTPRQHPWANEAEAELISLGDSEAAHATRSVLNWGSLVVNRSIWFLFVRAFASNLADVVYVYWIPQYLRDEKHLDPSMTGWLAALPLLGGACGGIASGLLQTRLIKSGVNRRWARSSIGFIGKLMAATLLLSSLALEQAVLIATALLVVKFFSDAEQPAEWGTISDLAGRNAATVFACVNTMGALGGFIAGPITGYVLGQFGWNAVFILTACEYVVAALAWMLIDCTKPIALSPRTMP